MNLNSGAPDISEGPVLLELIRLHYETSSGCGGSRIVILPVPHSWGDARLVSDFLNAIERSETNQRYFAPVQMTPFVTPAMQVEQLSRALGISSDERKRGRSIKELVVKAGLSGPSAWVNLATTTALYPLDLGGFEKVLIPLGCGAAAGIIHQDLLSAPMERSRRIGLKIARESIDFPTTLVVNARAGDDFQLVSEFLYQLICYPMGSVFLVVLVEPGSPILERLTSSDQPKSFRDRSYVLSPKDVQMDFSDRRELCESLLTTSTSHTIDRIAIMTESLEDVREVCSAAGLSDILQSEDAVTALDDFLNFFDFNSRNETKLNVFISLSGGVMHVAQFDALSEIVECSDTWGLNVAESIVRLERPGLIDYFRSRIALQFDSESLSVAASKVLDVAISLLESDECATIELTAALRPVTILLDTGILSPSEDALLCCCELIRIYSEVGDVRAAKELTRHTVRHSESFHLGLPLSQWLGETAQALNVLTSIGRVEGAELLAAEAVLRADATALFTVESRIWATMLCLGGGSTRDVGVDAALGVLAELDRFNLEPEVCQWRIQLALALISVGCAVEAVQALKPVLSLELDDDYRIAAQRVLVWAPQGDTALAIGLLELELDGTPPTAYDDRLRINLALSGMHRRRGAWTKAREHLQVVLDLRLEMFGEEHPDTLRTKIEFFHLIGVEGEWDSARERFEDLIPTLSETFGERHRATLEAEMNLATWTGYAQMVRGAESLFTELLERMVHILPADDSLYLVTRHQHGVLQGQADDFEAGIAIMAALIPDMERVLGADHEATLRARYQLVVFTMQAGRPQFAGELMRDLMPALVRVFGELHPDTLHGRFTLALLPEDVDHPAEVRDELSLLVPNMVQVFGASHEDTLNARFMLGRFMTLAGEPWPVTAGFFADLVEDMTERFTFKHPETLNVRNWFCMALAQSGADRAERAQSLLVELIDDMTEVIGPDAEDTFRARFWLTGVVGGRGDVKTALRMITALVDDMTRCLAPESPLTSSAKGWLAYWQSRQPPE